jgi:diketogulonate reductase-like aldo/keto reductase
MVVQNRCFAVTGWDKEVRDICAAQDLVYEGFSLLTANQEFLGTPPIQAIAKRLGAGIAQVIFRFSQQIGMLPLTGTTNAQHMKEDLQSDQFTLTPEDMRQIETIGLG